MVSPYSLQRDSLSSFAPDTRWERSETEIIRLCDEQKGRGPNEKMQEVGYSEC